MTLETWLATKPVHSCQWSVPHRTGVIQPCQSRRRQHGTSRTGDSRRPDLLESGIPSRPHLGEAPSEETPRSPHRGTQVVGDPGISVPGFWLCCVVSDEVADGVSIFPASTARTTRSWLSAVCRPHHMRGTSGTIKDVPCERSLLNAPGGRGCTGVRNILNGL